VPIWFFIQPICQTVVFTLLFGRIANLSVDGLPHIAFYLSGIVCWGYFSDTLGKISTVFRDNSQLFGKVYFPRLIIPLSIVVSNLVKFGVQFGLFIVVFIYYVCIGSIHPNIYILFFPFLLLLMAAQGLGLGMIISAMTNKYRDLGFIVTFGVQLWMYITPIVYPLSLAPAKYKRLLELNPMTTIIEWMRYGFLGKGNHDWMPLLYCFSVTTVIFVFGVLIFNKVEKNFIDTI
jgi:lipopolysaccharide transport system permease protein